MPMRANDRVDRMSAKPPHDSAKLSRATGRNWNKGLWQPLTGPSSVGTGLAIAARYVP